MRYYTCECGNTLFFESTQCLGCSRLVRFCPACRCIAPIESVDSDTGLFRCARMSCGAQLYRCDNDMMYNICNRACSTEQTTSRNVRLCDACRFNHTIPDLSVPGHLEKWSRLEEAKRRLLYDLDLLGLPYGSAAEGFNPPLSFDFKADSNSPDASWHEMGDERVFTGHNNGKITINVLEADEVERERLRVNFGEAHRTLVGHFRHEIAHYYWQLLVAGRSDRENDMKQVFGDPNDPPYEKAIENYYEQGPPVDWRQRHVSAYATMHPWEDWAETFAFYLDMTALLDTAQHFRLDGEQLLDMDDLDQMVHRFCALALPVNELNRTMGLIDLVPEVINDAVVVKMRAVHDLMIQVRHEHAATSEVQSC